MRKSPVSDDSMVLLADTSGSLLTSQRQEACPSKRANGSSSRATFRSPEICCCVRSKVSDECIRIPVIAVLRRLFLSWLLRPKLSARSRTLCSRVFTLLE